MAGQGGARTGIERLVADLTSPPAGNRPPGSATPDPLSAELAAWLANTPRFHQFAEVYRDKIRKKLRLAADGAARLDVRTELLVAHRLLLDRHVELAFEPGGTRGGPDFALTYRRTLAFHIEVTRVRRTDDEAGAARPILAKLRQLPAGAANVLLMAVPSGPAASWDVAAAVRAIRRRADAREETFLARGGFAGTRDFYDRFLRLGAVITWPEGDEARAWVNGSARIRVPERALRACLAALGSSEPGRRS